MKPAHLANRGFTLIEIMIVVGIIGMLAAIAIPNFTRSSETAKRTSCVNNLRQIEGAIQMWALETKKDSDQPVAYQDIAAYLRNLVVCPSGGETFADSYSLTTVDVRPACKRKPESHQLPQEMAR